MMTSNLSWLPELVLPDREQSLKQYISVVHSIYIELYVHRNLYLENTPIHLKRLPYRGEFDSTFYHLVSSSEDHFEDNRDIDIERCKRIRWPRSILDNSSDSMIKVWTNKRKGKTRTLLWLESFDFLVVLEKRKDYYLLWTAYITDHDHTRKKLSEEFLVYKAKTAI